MHPDERRGGERAFLRLTDPATWFGDAERVVAFSGHGPARRLFTAGQLAEDASALVRRLEHGHRARYLVVIDDAYALLVALLALWRHGNMAVLPPNGEARTLARLAPDVAGVLSDRHALVTAGARHPLSEAASDAQAALAEVRRWAALDPDAPACELFTSGTSGEGKSVVKRLRHLADEVAGLEAAFGAPLGGALVLGSASPLHLYGLLFRVLWPVSAGRTFDAETRLLPAELVTRLAATESFVWVSTPAHLRRLARHEGLARVSARCRAVFSSGGALDGETARLLVGAGLSGAHEIYGSTETGGVATRLRDGGASEPPWRPMPGVEVERDEATGRALVRSRFVSEGADDGSGRASLLTGDAIVLLAGGGFQLAGRVDRVVKVGEKRLSLPEMEARLRAHAFVDDAHLVLLSRGGEMRVAAAVVPSAEGASALEGAGRRAVVSALQARLAEEFDRVLLPRAFRFVHELPVDARGKTRASEVEALFGAAELEPSAEPELLAESRGPDRVERRFRVPEDLSCLEGHFPGHPVVPGVVILRWAIETGEALLRRELPLESVERLKFHEQLRPGDELVLEVELERASGTLQFLARDGSRRFASGRLRLLGDDGGAA